MKIPPCRALVLSAGLGLRLRPLTLFLPKPLLPVCGRPVVEHTLRDLAGLGCEQIALNLHHLGEQIQGSLGAYFEGVPISYSWEDEIQGTLGALVPVRDLLAEAGLVLLVNGDTLCPWPWKKLIRTHLKSGADATLLLLKRPPEEALGGGVGVDPQGRVVQIRDSEPTGPVARRHVFAGAHVLAPHLLDRIAAGPGDIVADLYIPLLAEGGELQSLVTSRRWHDLGTPARYLEACLDWIRTSKMDLRQRSAVAAEARVAEPSDLQRSVVEAGAVVESGARVEGSVLLPGARATTGSIVRDSILGPDVALPPATTIERRLVTRVRSGHPTHSRDSVMGDLVYSLLEDSEPVA